MGIYIPNMDMPKEGFRLLLLNADGTVQSTVGETTAIHVPPHGRLGDLDALMENCMKEDTFLAEMLFRKLSNAPTIIPASDD